MIVFNNLKIIIIIYIANYVSFTSSNTTTTTSTPIQTSTPILNTTTTTSSTPIQSSTPLSRELPPLPTPILPHQLRKARLNKPVLYWPQPFSYPGYPVVVYL